MTWTIAGFLFHGDDDDGPPDFDAARFNAAQRDWWEARILVAALVDFPCRLCHRRTPLEELDAHDGECEACCHV